MSLREMFSDLGKESAKEIREQLGTVSAWSPSPDPSACLLPGLNATHLCLWFLHQYNV